MAQTTGLTQPSSFIKQLQWLLVDFIWLGHHWVWESVLYLPVAEGGPGLWDIVSRAAAFRLKASAIVILSAGCGSAAWGTLSFLRAPDAKPGMWLFEDLLFDRDFLSDTTFPSASMWRGFIIAGIVKLGHPAMNNSRETGCQCTVREWGTWICLPFLNCESCGGRMERGEQLAFVPKDTSTWNF